MKYLIKARGYGGSGPSLKDRCVDTLEEARREIEDLIESDHGVDVYRLDDNGTQTEIEFEYYTRVHVYFVDE